jgi:hypothetical protein
VRASGEVLEDDSAVISNGRPYSDSSFLLDIYRAWSNKKSQRDGARYVDRSSITDVKLNSGNGRRTRRSPLERFASIAGI